ncbi:MAG: tagaturonate reductase [Saprospiraceae bacterium]|nr:tagaturonate reductase [Saprospiraceae bacterium]
MKQKDYTMQKLSRIHDENQGQRTLKVLQFGGGNFMRAYIDWMVNHMNKICNYQGGVVIVKPTRQGNYDELIAQEGLYHLVTSGFAKGQTIDEIELITCVDEIIQPYEQFDRFIATAKEPDLRVIVSNTTESGIVYEAKQNPSELPENFPAKLCLWLKSRYDHFEGASEKGCIILPCELIEKNGEILQQIVLQYAAEWMYGEDFVHWLQSANVFANTLVDRIVPGLPKEDQLSIYQQRTGFEDAQMVVAEPYHLFVIEGPEFIENEFPLKRAGINAVITRDLANYRLQKVRLLNGGHTSLVPVGILLGIETVGQFVKDPLLFTFLDNLMRLEIISSIREVDEDQLLAYADDVLDRFKNPFVQHRLSSIALNSISKFTVRILPSIENHLRNTGELPERLVLSFAALIRFYQGEWRGEKLPIQDNPERVQIIQKWWHEKSTGRIDLSEMAEQILGEEKLWGRNLNEIPNLKMRVSEALDTIEKGQLMAKIKSWS